MNLTTPNNNTSTPAYIPPTSTPTVAAPTLPTSQIQFDANNNVIPNSTYTPQTTSPIIAAAISSTPPTITPDVIGTQPVKVPSTPTSQTPIVPPPTTPIDPKTGAPYPVDANGNLVMPTVDTPSAYDTALNKISGLNDQMATKGQVGNDLYNQLGIDQKTRDSIQAYNDYNYAKTDVANRIEALRTQEGGLTGSRQTEINALQAQSDAHLTNLAYQSAVATGNLSAAQNILSQKLDMQFKPVQDQIDNLSKFAELNQNNLSDAQKAAIQLKATQLQNNTDLLKSAMTTAHQFAQQQGITDINTLNAIDSAKSPAEAYAAVNMSPNGSPLTQGTGIASLSQQAQQYVDASGDGTPFVSEDRLSNLTPYQKQQLSADYAKAGIRVLQPGEVSALNTIDQASADLGLFEANANKLLSPGTLGRIKGLTTNQLAQWTQTNPEWRQFQTLRAGLIKSVQGIAAGAPGLRVTGAELSNAADALPNSADNLQSAQQAVQTFRDLLSVNKNILLRTSTNNNTTGNLSPVTTKVGVINPNF
jgi:hypothetical protein